MAAMILAMLFIGIGMVGSLSGYHRLMSVHKRSCFWSQSAW
jgi:hypothetical protein